MWCKAPAVRSREEVNFDNKGVTSVDWRTYPILT